MTLYSLMEQVEHYNKLAEILGNKKVYVRFDGFERIYNRRNLIDMLENKYLNRVSILTNELIPTEKRNEFKISDDGFNYEVVVFNEF